MSKGKLPEFFKVFLGEESSDPLKIPPSFVGHMGRKASGSVKLRGPGGDCWEVQLAWKGDELCFGEGWGAFVEDNLTTVGDFLIFSYDGNSLFEVKILDPSACEKEASFSAKCSQAVAESIDKGRKKISRANRASSSHEIIGDSTKRNSKMSESNTICPKGRSTARCNLKSADSLASSRPSFVTCMKKYNVLGTKRGGRRYDGIMFTVPAEFIKEHNLSYKRDEEIVLLNDKGNSWTVGIIPRANDRNKISSHVLTRGWSAFVRDNNIKVGDTCIFELKKRLEMCVHIIRKRS